MKSKRDLITIRIEPAIQKRFFERYKYELSLRIRQLAGNEPLS